LTLAFYKYEFELTSLKPIIENLNFSEKIVNKIFFQIEKAEQKVKDLNLSKIFKKDMNYLVVYSKENFIPLTIRLDELVENLDGHIREEIHDFNQHFKENIDKFQQFLHEIIEKTPEIIGPFERFNELNNNIIPEIYNLLDKLRSIYSDILPEIDEKIFNIYTQQIRPIHAITDRRRENKSKFKSFKAEIEDFLANFTPKKTEAKKAKPKKAKSKKKKSKKTKSKKIKSKKVKSKKNRPKAKQKNAKPTILEEKYNQIEELKTEFLSIFDNLNELIALNDIEQFDIEIISLVLFKGNLENLKKYTNDAFKIIKEIDIFIKELNFGIIFQEDLDLLNDIFYDYFNPLLKTIDNISKKENTEKYELVKEFVKEFQKKIIRTQDKLKEVIEYSIEPLKRIDLNLDLVLSPFSDLKNSLRKINLKSGHIYSEIKNVLKYVQNIAMILSNKYLKELKSMSDELKIYSNELKEFISY